MYIKPVRSWEELMKEVGEIVDAYGMPVDAGIREVVAAFRLHDFTTSGSCEGHLPKAAGGDKLGNTYPWVEVYLPEPDEWEKARGRKRRGIEEEWKRGNLLQQQRMIEWLGRFYQGRKTPLDVQLTLCLIGAFGAFRVQSLGAAVMALLKPPELERKLIFYRKEMLEFGLFLKEHGLTPTNRQP